MHQKTLVYLILLIWLIIISPSQTFAHNGPRDELGGHFRSSDCVYILHEPTPLAETANNMEELITLIIENNSNTTCTNQLIDSKVDLEGYTFQTTATPKKKEPSNKTASTSVRELLIGHTYEATLEKCTDGDTANFLINGEIYKTRFLYIDTPESTNKIEPYGKEASEYSCTLLKQGKIMIETDGNALFDKYGRLLAWVWVGDLLHQEEITKAGFVKDFYDYGNYKYEDRIHAAMKDARENNRGMYASESDESGFNYFLGLFVIIGAILIITVKRLL
ncbi:thermonuclease family protein [Bacillus sp. 31A1R]|uniref:Thermonuclease family protein n=1 Tax=Robertmurraya mangrovi TaxID=3098077 RepID=A0ABU5J2W1_9BACI|nr:thermonuclease family protein [Bacillus sp. 31A1R]MDZ5473739.1 thermonuclease family protein [Bacillus sp. 31A1R]